MRQANERRLIMNKIIKQGALALSLFAGAALVSGPVFADSIHDHGHFGGTWNRIGPSHHYRQAWRGYDRGYAYRGYYGPRPYADYGPRYYDYGYGPGYVGRPGVGFSIGIY
jgi:hypothetical protein